MNRTEQQTPPKVYNEWSNPFLLNAIRYNNAFPLDKLKPYVYRDEIGDMFLLTKNMELYLDIGYTPETIGEAVLGVYFWYTSSRLKGHNRELFYDLWRDDELWHAKMKLEHLTPLLQLYPRSNQYSRKSKKIKKLEEFLGHRIIPLRYNTFHRLINMEICYDT